MFGGSIGDKKLERYNMHPLSSIVGDYSIPFKDLQPVRIQSGTNLLRLNNPLNLNLGNYDVPSPKPVYPEIFTLGLGYSSAFPSDPVTTGPGLWYMIHLSAYEADTPEKIKEYLVFLRKIITKHPCGTCRHHGSKYLQMFPPENYIDTKNEEGRLTGMFLHAWMFHNTVNDRLNKEIMPWQTAWDMFGSTDVAVCQKDCGKKSENFQTRNPESSDQTRLSTSYGRSISLVPKRRFGPTVRNDINYIQPVNYFKNRYR
uniref:Sulfhydryl oxidase n=1 Tax=Pithovirus LCPAC201 TaxID=2506591 RepID=A0A481Z6N7_9VIRU|nr:MAG: Erv1/Alr family disulfide (thiol) oxidoreductase [Pithovirus LCPAC201]